MKEKHSSSGVSEHNFEQMSIGKYLDSLTNYEWIKPKSTYSINDDGLGKSTPEQ